MADGAEAAAARRLAHVHAAVEEKIFCPVDPRVDDILHRDDFKALCAEMKTEEKKI